MKNEVKKVSKELSIKFKDFQAEGENKGAFTAYLSKFGIVDRAQEHTVKGCADDSILKNNGGFTLLYNHAHEEPIGFFKLVDDGIGLLMDGKFNLSEDVPLGRKAYALALQAKEMDIALGFSIGYIEILADWDDAKQSRALKIINLLEGSFAPIPCLPDAKLIDVKKMQESTKEIEKDKEKIEVVTEIKTVEIKEDITTNPRTFEKHLCDVGFSNSESKRIASLAINHRDDEELSKANESLINLMTMMENSK